MKSSTKKALGFAAIGAAILLFFKRGVTEPPPDTSGNTPPTIPPLSSDVQLTRVTFDCKDVGITSMNNWVVLLGIPIHNLADSNIKIHIQVKGPGNAEVAHLINSTVMPSGAGLKTYNMPNDSIAGLQACTIYSAYCWVTDTTETVSYFGIKSAAWRTKGCT